MECYRVHTLDYSNHLLTHAFRRELFPLLPEWQRVSNILFPAAELVCAMSESCTIRK